MPPIVTDTWNTVFFQPMLNGLILLYSFLFNNFGLTVIVFTVLVRMVILPLTLRQLHAAKAMSRLQPEMAKLQKRYGNDKQKISQEQMRLYKEHGVNPLGCAVPTLVQFPVWIGLYQSILLALAATPESLMRLSSHLYPNLTVVHELVPLENHFLWLDLAVPDSLFRQLFGLPIDIGPLPLLVAGSMWIQQKMSTIPSEDPRQKQMNQTMQWMMPMMFGYMTVFFASGLALYWLVSNVISVVVQYFVTGWGSLTWFTRGQVAQVTAPIAPAPIAPALEDGTSTEESSNTEDQPEKRPANGKPRSKRRVSRRGR